VTKTSLPAGMSATPGARDHALTRRATLARRRWTETLFLGTQVALDALLVALAWFIAYRVPVALHLLRLPREFSTMQGLIVLGIIVGTTLLVFAIGGLYRLGRGASRVDTFYKICTHLSLAVLLAIAANAIVLHENVVLSRRVLVLGWLLAIAMVTTGRLLHSFVVGQVRLRGVAVDRLLIVGTGTNARIVHDKIRKMPELGYHLVGFLAHPSEGTPPDTVNGVPVYGTTGRLAEVVRRHRIDELILALEGTPHAEALDLVYQVMDLPVNIRVYPDLFRLITNDELTVSDLGGLPMVTVRTAGLRTWSRIVKRAVDLAVSSAVLVFCSPLMLLLAILIKLDSPGPVFFVQERVGHDGVPFNLLKFRSMPVDAEKETGPVWATPDDPRPTRIGRFMRRYSLDELPQFINVFLGEMSVVGPRPERPHFVEQFRQTIPYYMARHREKSGITGWAQVNGLRGDTSIQERTQYDLYYVENWSLLFDIKIMIKTLARIINDENAY